jgi:3-oxoacyl-[acyl-carrier-protein] synthase II
MGCQIGAGLISAEVQELGSAMVTAVRPGTSAAELLESGGRWDTRAWGTKDPGDGSAMGGMGNLPPLWMLKYLPNMLACHVSIIHGAEGPSNTHTCSEASGLLSIGEATRVIERDGADCCFAGSAESKLNVNAAVRIAIAKRLAHAAHDEDPLKVVRPFSPETRGSLFGEGGGILVLEEEAKARARQAQPYAKILGFGAAQSTHNVIPPFQDPVGGAINEGLADAIDRALADAQLSPGSVRAVVSQACGIRAFDSSEAAALASVFANRSVPVVGLVPFLGDCLAGNGGMQTAVAAMILRNAALPPLLMGSAGEQSSGPVVVCSSSQGGQNAAIVLGVA